MIITSIHMYMLCYIIFIIMGYCFRVTSSFKLNPDAQEFKPLGGVRERERDRDRKRYDKL